MLDFILMTPEMLLSSSGVLIALATAISIIALSFMAGEFFSMPTLRGFAKAELYELGVTAVVIAISVMLITPGGPFDMITRGFLDPGTPADRACKEWKSIHGQYDPVSGNYPDGNLAFAHADYFIGCRVDFLTQMTSALTLGILDTNSGIMIAKLTTAYMNLMLMEFFMGFLSTVNFHLTILTPILIGIDIGLPPHAGLTPLLEFNTTLTDMVGSTIAAMTAKKMLLNFIEENAIGVFLVLGIFLRALPFTRKTGSTIIAIVFAAYFVFPTSVLLNQQIWRAIENPPGPPGCLEVGTACTADSECCSGNCAMGAGRCAAMLSDFDHVKSFINTCYGKSEDEIRDSLDSQAQHQQAQLEQYFDDQGEEAVSTRTTSRLKSSLGTAGNVIVGPMLSMNIPIGSGPLTFGFVEKAMNDMGRLMLIILIFTVIEILLTITLMKDFAIMIGGEPRVLGISKLV